MDGNRLITSLHLDAVIAIIPTRKMDPALEHRSQGVEFSQSRQGLRLYGLASGSGSVGAASAVGISSS